MKRHLDRIIHSLVMIRLGQELAPTLRSLRRWPAALTFLQPLLRGFLPDELTLSNTQNMELETLSSRLTGA